MQMYLVLKLTFMAVMLGNALLLCVAVLLFMMLQRVRTRAREAETPSESDRQREKAVREDAEAWRRIQNYNVRDAYGGGDG